MRARGLTLLEVLIGVALLSLMAVVLAQIAGLMTTGRQRADRRALAYHVARVSLERVARDVGMAFLVASPALKGSAAGAPVLETAFRGLDRGDADELDFTTLSGGRYVANRKESDQREVGYQLAPMPEGEEGKRLVRRESRWVSGDIREGGEVVPLCDRVTVFRLEYFDPEKGEWDSDWDSTERAHQGKLPAAVRVTLTLRDPNLPERELTVMTVARVGLAPGPVEF